MSLRVFQDIVDDTTGAAAIEYGLIAALIVIAMLASLQGVAGEAIAMWDFVKDESIAAMNK